MKPSRTPCFFSKLSLYSARSAITSLMSTSLKVVSWAAVFCDSFRRSAMVLRRRRHRHALFAVGIVGAARRDSAGAGAWRAGGAGFQRGQHVALGDAAILAGAGDVSGIECRFLPRCARTTASARCIGCSARPALRRGARLWRGLPASAQRHRDCARRRWRSARRPCLRRWRPAPRPPERWRRP